MSDAWAIAIEVVALALIYGEARKGEDRAPSGKRQLQRRLEDLAVIFSELRECIEKFKSERAKDAERENTLLAIQMYTDLAEVYDDFQSRRITPSQLRLELQRLAKWVCLCAPHLRGRDLLKTLTVTEKDFPSEGGPKRLAWERMGLLFPDAGGVAASTVADALKDAPWNRWDRQFHFPLSALWLSGFGFEYWFGDIRERLGTGETLPAWIAKKISEERRHKVRAGFKRRRRR